MLNLRAKRRLGMYVLTAVISLCAGLSHAATGYGLSNIFTIDNRGGSDNTPIVTGLSNQYCSYSGHVYFISGVSLNQEFTVAIDWKGFTASEVKWYRNSTVIATDTVSGNSASRTFDVGTDFNAGEKLYVQAIADDSTESPKVKANFEVIASPSCVPANLLSVEINNTSLKYKTGSFSLQWPNFDAELPDNTSEVNTAGIRSIGTSTFDTIIEVSANITGEGTCSIKMRTDKLGMKKKDAFSLAGVGFEAQVWVNIILTYENQWLPGGGIGCSVSADKKFGPKYWIFAAGPVPIPIFLKGAVSVGLESELALTGFGGAEDLGFSGAMSPSAGLEVVLGCGLSNIAAVEGYLAGTAGLTAEFEWPDDVSINGHFLALDGGVRAYFFIFKYENNLLHFQWPEEQSAPMQMMATPMAVDSLVPMSRDYVTADYAQWHGDISVMKTMGAQALGAGSGTETTLQTNIFGQSDAVLAVSGGTKCLVWLYDEPTRNSLDRTMLVYSVNDGGGWSVPVAVNDDGTADAMPALAVDAGGNFVCVWANASQLIPDGTDLGGFADKLDIQMGVYDAASNTWTTETVTDASALDYNPKVACDAAGNITVLWTHDDNNDMLAENPPVTNSIMARTKTGAGWQAAQTLATVSGLVKYTDIEADLAATHIVYCLDSDSDYQTDADNELYYINNASASWSAAARLTNDIIADVNPQLVNASTGLMLIWAADGKIVSTTDISGMTGVADVVAQAGSSGQRGFVAAVSPTDNISVIWNDPSQAGSDIYTATYDPTMLAWSDIVQMTDNRDMERSITAAYSAGDTLQLAYNKVHIVDANGLDAFGQVDLCTYEYRIGADLTVAADSIAIDDPNAVPGDTVTLQATIANIGDMAVADIPVAFYCNEINEPNQIGTTQIISGSLAAGDETLALVSWTIPHSDEPLNIIVVIDPDLQIEDKNRQNNSASIEMFGANIAIENVVINSNDGDFYITADIVNTGFVPVPDGIEFNLAIADDPDNIIDSQSVAALQADQTHTITLAVASEQIAYGFNLIKLTIDPDNIVAETSESDNTRTVLLKNTVPYDLVIDGVINALDLNVLASQWLYSTGGLSADIAPYNGDGTVNISDLAKLAENWQINLSGGD